MALRISKHITEALAAARAGDQSADLSKLTIPRMRGGHLVRKALINTDTTRSFFLSDKSVDRDRDTIDAEGWDLAEFKRNGAVLFAHNNRSTPIAEPLNTTVSGKGDAAGLYGDARFPTAEVDEFGALVLRLIDDGILKNVSVGFIPLKWTINEERQGIDFTAQKLVEWSVVPVGSHPGAMVQLARSKGLDLAPLEEWATKWLDNDESVASAVADDGEIAVLHKSLAPWRRSPAGLVVPAATVERAAETVRPKGHVLTEACAAACDACAKACLECAEMCEACARANPAVADVCNACAAECRRCAGCCVDCAGVCRGGDMKAAGGVVEAALARALEQVKAALASISKEMSPAACAAACDACMIACRECAAVCAACASASPEMAGTCNACAVACSACESTCGRCADACRGKSAPDPVQRALAQLEIVASAVKLAAMSTARSEKISALLREAGEVLRAPPEAPVTTDDVRAMVREALAEVTRAPEPQQIDAAEAVALVREAMAELKAELLRDAGRLPV